ncbi:Lec1p Ecym_2608 [Eremothecium cymbalariae DBVPG|uniref:PX domain-containing protein n=1 Tax=Eremothecium cymbalariae (strain CBS 270.75 / DBVPG 7215 / KCTC 17166 / NRRL Y-17582) TaxID=931890 RepID=G8JQI8_ERECY|nr:Hypothetical protein Ecym_2608 [Eremothecium cymbalariae DBVPG\
MVISLSPTEEHYLKRELLRIELNDEFQKLNDRDALRRFGYPFMRSDPRKRDGNIKDLLESSVVRRKAKTLSVDNDLTVTEFPLLSHFLQNVVITCPLLSKKLANDRSFWEKKVQVFFEHFMSLPFSSSYDREELTKRRRFGLKLSKLVLLFYNSGIGTTLEPMYYQNDSSASVQVYSTTNDCDTINSFTMFTKETLRNMVTKQPVYFNGIDINVISVLDEDKLFKDEEERAKTENMTTTPSWFKSTFSTVLPPKFLPKMPFYDSGNSQNKVFLIAIRKEGNQDNIKYTAKLYEDFKRLTVQLQKEFPGKKILKLPDENKLNSFITTESSDLLTLGKEVPVKVGISSSANTSSSSIQNPNISSGWSSNTNEDTEFVDAEESPQDNGNFKIVLLEQENMRTSLRQFLRSICQDKEICKSISLRQFLFRSNLDPAKFSEDLILDIRHRELVDIHNLENQIKFQKMAYEKTIVLQSSLKTLKDSILRDENYLLKLFREIREKDNPNDLSEPLKNFFEWTKIYLSATIYQVFLGNDDSYEFYSQVRRLHRLMPYAVMSKVVKFTNPMAVMKAMIDLFMIQPFGGYSLLQNMFSNILSDDLRGQIEVINDLEALIKSDGDSGPEICQVLYMCIFENENGEYINMENINLQSQSENLPAVLIIARECYKKKYLSSEALVVLNESYSSWSRANSGDITINSTNSSISKNPGLYFSHVKELLQLYIRERDKKLMRQLWQESELPTLLRSIVTLFYEPLVKIFKVAKIDVAMKSFEKFMNDLVALMDHVISGKEGSSTQANIVEDIHELVNAHEEIFYTFVHDIYINDTENIFEGFIKWACDITSFLQTSKWGGPEIRINLDLVLKSNASSVDYNTLKKQLEQLVDQKMRAREVYSRLAALKAEGKAQSKVENVGEVIDANWRQMNNLVIPSDVVQFGIDDSELVDLDLDVGDFEFLEAEDKLQKKYHDILNSQVDVSEINKLNETLFKKILKDTLSV